MMARALKACCFFIMALALRCSAGDSALVDPCGEGCGVPDLQLAVEVYPATTETEVVLSELLADEIQQTDSGLTLEVPDAVEVTVIVADDNGTAIPASLVLTRASRLPGRPPIVTIATTDAEGVARMTVLPLDEAAGTYELRATPTKPKPLDDFLYPPIFMQGVVIDSAATIDVVMPARDELLHIEGRLLPAVEGEPIPAYRVRAETSSGAVSTSSAANTDGYFDIDAQPFSGEYTVRVDPPEGITGPTFFYDALAEEPTAQGLELQLPALPSTQMFCMPGVGGLDTAGVYAPVAGAQLVFETDLADVVESYNDATGSGVDGATMRVEAVTDASGQATFALLPGTTEAPRLYTVGVTPPSDSPFAATVIEDFAVAPPGYGAGDCPNLPQIDLPLRVALTGVVETILEDGTMGPVAGATVEAVRRVKTPTVAPTAPAVLTNPQSTTDATGQFLIWVDGGTYNLEAQPAAESGLPRWSRDDVWAHMDVEDLQIELPPPITTDVLVLRRNGAALESAIVRIYTVKSDDIARLRGDSTTDAAGHAYIVLPDP